MVGYIFNYFGFALIDKKRLKFHLGYGLINTSGVGFEFPRMIPAVSPVEVEEACD